MLRTLIAFAGLITGLLSLLVVGASALGKALDAPILVHIGTAHEYDYAVEKIFLYDLNHNFTIITSSYTNQSISNAFIAPDGHTIAIVSGYGSDSTVALARMNEVWQLESETIPIFRNEGRMTWGVPAWSPVIRDHFMQLAIVTNQDAAIDPFQWSDLDIWVVDVPVRPWQGEDFYREGSEDMIPALGEAIQLTRRRLTDDSSNEFGLAWSPDGKQIAFVSNRDGRPDIYVLETSGTNQNIRRITDHPADDLNPAWSPDGQWIVFESYRDGSPIDIKTDIFIVSAQGGHAYNLTLTPEIYESNPTWTPDGRSIIYSDGNRLKMISPTGIEQRSLSFSFTDYALLP